jgi:hypothetical protein
VKELVHVSRVFTPPALAVKPLAWASDGHAGGGGHLESMIGEMVREDAKSHINTASISLFLFEVDHLSLRNYRAGLRIMA